ncbi:MAG: RodZ domain-containing protein [Phormidesmis sp.]
MTKFSAAQQNQLAQIGAFLRENREKQGKSLEDIAIHTYIRPQLLSGIETGDPDLLPEPIFVQGFIRRYAENLGLKGLELSQQFTVNSIPSTPRPAPRVAEESSSTTRLTRGRSPVHTPAAPDANTLFNASSLPTAGRFNRDTNGSSPASPVQDTPVSPATDAPSPGIESPFANDIPVVSGALETNGLNESDPVSPIGEEAIATPAETPGSFEPEPFKLDPLPSELSTELPAESAVQPISEQSPENGFADQVAAFDQANLDPANAEIPPTEALELAPSAPFSSEESLALNDLPDPALRSETERSETDAFTDAFGSETAGTAPSETSASETNSLETNSLDTDASGTDVLGVDTLETENPAVGTTELSESSGGTPTVSETESAEVGQVAAPRAVYSDEPVGVEITPEGPNLKPFAIGAVVVAALTAGVVLLANLLGGDRTSVADAPEPPPEPVVEEVVPEPVAPEPEPVSTAPVYVETEATAETYVSISVDGTIVFEDIMQPGDIRLWEGQEVIDVYSGNAGGLIVAANGEPGEVLGEDAQLGQKIFEAE